MKRRTRRVLFFIATAMFVFFSYVAILYAQGYKYSFRDNKFVRTGAIYLDVNTDANIYFNDRLVGSTSFLGRSFSKGGLLPGKYTVRVTYDGYTTWQKKTVVEEGFVVDFPKIMILSESEDERAKLIAEIEGLLNVAKPEISPTLPILSPKTLEKQNRGSSISQPNSKNLGEIGTTSEPSQSYFVKNKLLYKNDGNQLEVLAQNIVGFAMVGNESRIAWWNSNNEIWVMWLRDTSYQPYRKIGDKELLTRLSTRIKNISWFRDEDHIVVDSLGYEIIELDTRGGINIIKL